MFTWRSGQRDLYAATGRICGSRQGTHGVQSHQELVWTKAAPSQWYKKFESFMTKSGFCKAEKDPCCYFKKYTDSYVFLLLYVDDMLIAGSSMRKINNLKTRLSAAFEMKDLGLSK